MYRNIQEREGIITSLLNELPSSKLRLFIAKIVQVGLFYNVS
jgi:hypothetical protein